MALAPRSSLARAMAQFEEFVVNTRKREFVADDSLLTELKSKGFEPQIVGEIDPPPRHGGSWVLRDKRDRRSHEDGGVWISWTRSREGSVKYVVETFDGRSGYDYFMGIMVAALIADRVKGQVLVDRGPGRDASAFLADVQKDSALQFHGPESAVDWESSHLDEEVEEDDEEYEEAGEDFADE